MQNNDQKYQHPVIQRGLGNSVYKCVSSKLASKQCPVDFLFSLEVLGS